MISTVLQKLKNIADRDADNFKVSEEIDTNVLTYVDWHRPASVHILSNHWIILN